ncbi:reverse transcriptase [Gossypium australe]|uniref:Reverse transcriptase n=1 Tax=Gossypium australe TaxID=47621 RepID=A0A5B6UXF8_9ROSI|nr:reverse transcriptase [Gossypium australe]
MWKPLNPVQLMDLENDFYLVRFNNEKDYNRVLVGGLPEGYYSGFLLRAIRQAIGLVVKLDTHIDFARRVKFARLAVCVDLKKPLAPKVKINGQT